TRTYSRMTKPNARATTSGRTTESRRRRQLARGSASQLSTSGVAMRTPSVSPTHHVHHVITTSDHGIWPLATRVVTPTVALTRQLSGPPSSRKVQMSRARVSGLGKPTQRHTSAAPTKACTVAPAPILAEIITEVSNAAAWLVSHTVQRLATNDPSQMPTPTRAPPMRTPASARPEAGQIAVA